MAAFSALVEASTLLWESIQGVSGKDTEIGNHKGYVQNENSCTHQVEYR